MRRFEYGPNLFHQIRQLNSYGAFNYKPFRGIYLKEEPGLSGIPGHEHAGSSGKQTSRRRIAKRRFALARLKQHTARRYLGAIVSGES
jgi:hypothetical protein